VSDQTDQPGPPAAPPDDAEPTTCYRHPAREAHVRCTRCNRRICPDCMIDASVGFQCPECVREGNRSVREARTSLGGRLTDNAGLVTKVIIAINVLVFLAEQASPSFLNHFVLIGDRVDAFGQLVGGVADGEYYRLLTAAFMHENILHIAFNMYALYLFGPPLEATLGRVRFVSLYLMSALGGSAASYALIAPNAGSLGASGAVFGLFGAFFIVNRKFGRDNSGLFVLVAINLAIAFVPNTNIDWHAHVGGLLTGAVVAAAFAYAPSTRRTIVQAAGCVAVLLMIVIVIAWRTSQLT
jgi:membrane associated rhomboid family serine protease